VVAPDEPVREGSGPKDLTIRDPRSRFRRRLEDGTQRAVVTGRVVPYLAGMTAVLAVASGVLVRVVDHKDFHTLGDGVWWAIVTLATVGYGDIVPTSPWGRVIGGAVIVLGVTFLSFLMASVTSYFVTAQQERATEHERVLRQEAERESMALLRKLDERLAAIEEKLDRRQDDG
jgi:voltage-gated potassium channel